MVPWPALLFGTCGSNYLGYETSGRLYCDALDPLARGKSTSLLLGISNRSDDVGIGAAATDIAAHVLANLGVCMGNPFVHQPHAGADLAGRAVTALKSVALDKRFLKRVQTLSIRQAFNGRDARSRVHRRQRKAGIDPP